MGSRRGEIDWRSGRVSQTETLPRRSFLLPNYTNLTGAKSWTRAVTRSLAATAIALGDTAAHHEASDLECLLQPQDD